MSLTASDRPFSRVITSSKVLPLASSHRLDAEESERQHAHQHEAVPKPRDLGLAEGAVGIADGNFDGLEAEPRRAEDQLEITERIELPEITAAGLNPHIVGAALSSPKSHLVLLTLFVMDAKATALWEKVYAELTAEVPGLLGAICGRADPQTLRVALIYAVLLGLTGHPDAATRLSRHP
jgi:hypothetical protein